MTYAFKLAGAAIGLLLFGLLGIVIFGNVWARVGLGAALVVICAPLLLLAWRSDRKTRQAREGLEDI